MRYWETDFNRDEQPVIDELRKNGYFVYGLRDDFGDHYLVEPKVLVNRIGFLVTDEPIIFHSGPSWYYGLYITDEELTEIGVADEAIRDAITKTREKMK